MTRKIIKSQKARYVVGSAFNAAFGYFVVIGLHAVLYPALNMFAIGILANVLGITVSFTTYKWFVFRSRGNWLSEYLKCYVVYGLLALVNAVGLWVLVDMIGLSVWLAPAIMIALCFVGSYFSHANFTFKA